MKSPCDHDVGSRPPASATAMYSKSKDMAAVNKTKNEILGAQGLAAKAIAKCPNGPMGSRFQVAYFILSLLGSK